MTSLEVKERVEKAKDLFKSGYTCSQSVLLAYSDIFGLDGRTAAILSAPFGGGMGRLREVCGTVSGMTMIAGLLCPLENAVDREMKKRNYSLVQKFAEEFRTENGSIICRELLGLSCRRRDPEPSERNDDYYRKRPCVDLVGCAAEIVGRYICESGFRHG